MSKITVGSIIPDFTLKDQNGKDFKVFNFVGSYNLVIYFYPKDDTPGCTAEACAFRDQYEDFNDKGAMVIGISSDSPESHKRFAEKHNLSFTLLSDEDGKLRKQFGVPTDFLGLLPGRVTYVVDKSGAIRNIFNSQFNFKKHIKEALKILDRL
ncbi:MAG: peroxiredoxin [Bacteroidales bacterium]